ncbi:MAG: hypothetical protein ABW346_00665, partial [Terrimicrobium sp.]
ALLGQRGTGYHTSTSIQSIVGSPPDVPDLKDPLGKGEKLSSCPSLRVAFGSLLLDSGRREGAAIHAVRRS